MNEFKVGRTTRRLLNACIYGAIATCVIVFSMGVHDTMSGKASAQPPGNTTPLNSTLLFTLFAAPILASLLIAICSFVLQQYRASNGTRDRGWEEEW